MSDTFSMIRSSELMSAGDTALLVVDVQDRLIGHIPNQETIIWNIGRLLEGGKILGVPAAATEQYPKGLGSTVSSLAEQLGEIPSKLSFSCASCEEIFDHFAQSGIVKLLVVGIEAHVCVQQTVLDMLASGFRVYLAVDAVGSRHPLDYDFALRRMESAGATLTTTESALFEWCEVAGTSAFKKISELVRQVSPDR